MNPQRGEIYFAPFGEGKERPVVVVSRDSLNAGTTVVVIPFSTKRLDERRTVESAVFFHRGDGGLVHDCVAKADEITVMDKKRLNTERGRVGRLSLAHMNRIVRAIRYVVRDGELESSRSPVQGD